MLKRNLRYLNLLFDFFGVKIVGFQQNFKISQNNAFDQIYGLIKGIIFVNRIMKVIRGSYIKRDGPTVMSVTIEKNKASGME